MNVGDVRRWHETLSTEESCVLYLQQRLFALSIYDINHSVSNYET